MLVTLRPDSLYTQECVWSFFRPFSAQGRPSQYYPFDGRLRLLVRRAPWTRGEGFYLEGFAPPASLVGDPCYDTGPLLRASSRSNVAPVFLIATNVSKGLLKVAHI